MVAKEGLEPSRTFIRQILSLLRLPLRHLANGPDGGTRTRTVRSLKPPPPAKLGYIGIVYHQNWSTREDLNLHGTMTSQQPLKLPRTANFATGRFSKAASTSIVGVEPTSGDHHSGRIWMFQLGLRELERAPCQPAPDARRNVLNKL